MPKRVYIETDVHTANLVEVLLDEMRRLHEKVDRLERLHGTNEEPDVSPRLLTIDQTRRMLNISVSTLYHLRRDKIIPSKNIKGKVLFLQSDIEKYLDRG